MARSKVFTAKFQGKCTRCTSPVRVGQDACYIDNKFGHDVCPKPQSEGAVNYGVSNPLRRNSQTPLICGRCGSQNMTFHYDFCNDCGVSNPISAKPLPKPAPVQEKLVPGVYEVNGKVYVVKFNREKTNLYAKELVEVGEGVTRATEAGQTVKAIDFVYAPGAIFNIRLEHRMPVERAKELITLYSRCIACGHGLKAAKSVQDGIGPVCIKYFGPVVEEVKAVTVDGRKVTVQAA